jgi:tetratricopeptide (TPR) repeat protein
LIVPIAVGLCFSYIGTGRWDKVVDIAPGVLDLLEKAGRQSEFFAMHANPYSNLCGYCGASMGQLGNFEEGNIFLEKGLRHASQIHDPGTVAIVEYEYGLFFHTKGDWRSAIEHFQSGIKYGEEAKVLALLAWSWAFMGSAYSYLGDPETGRRYVEKGLKIQRDAGFEYLLSIYPLILSDICFRLGDPKNALNFANEALSLSQKNSDKHLEALSWAFLGYILGRTETAQIHKAEDYILQGMKILHELKFKPWNARGQLILGEVYANAGEKEKALENLKKAEAMFHEMGMDYWLAVTRKVSAEL